ncbi:DmX-like protein 1 [Nymphaea thermarum]|nr:DmX-like protein 1 [Nymphaea thermarum]
MEEEEEKGSPENHDSHRWRRSTKCFVSRFWVAVRFVKLHFHRKFGRAALAEELIVDSSLIAWAFQSDCHENLLSSVLSSEPSWLEMKNLGVGFWFTNATMLRARMEKLARAQFLKNKDPKDCALLYLALGRIKVLAGLFKLSKDEKDKPLFGFLSRNFQEDKNRAAALKNAYVLMGRHQLELAVAFFILGGDHSSAVTVCAKNLGDVQLALIICRLLEGCGGELERDLIANHILPSSIQKEDYWLASILEWMLGHYYQSYLCLLDGASLDCNPSKSYIHHAATDPNIGQYCAILATKSNIKNSLGDVKAAVLARWAMMMASLALARCGLPTFVSLFLLHVKLQALELVSSGSSLGGKIQDSVSGSRKLNTIYGILRPNSQTDPCNWLSGDVAPMLESCVRLNLALRCTSKFIIEHLSSENAFLTYSTMGESFDIMSRHHEELADALYEKLQDGIFYFGTKYSINATRILNMILHFTCNIGKPFLGYHVTNTYLSSVHLQHKLHGTKNFIDHSFTTKAVIHVTKEICYEFGRCVVALGIMASVMKIDIQDTASNGKTDYRSPWEYHLYDLLQSVWYVKLFLKFLIDASTEVGFSLKISSDLDHLSYCICFALACLHQNSEVLLQLIQSILDIPEFVVDGKERKQSTQIILHRDSFKSSVPIIGTEHNRLLEKRGMSVESVCLNDERWQLLVACLWQNLFTFTLKILEVRKNENLLGSLPASEPFLHPDPKMGDFNGSGTVKQIELFPLFVLEPLINAISYVFCGLTKELIFLLVQKLEKNMDVVALTWLSDVALVQSKVPVQLDEREIDSSKREHSEEALPFEHLWETIVKPELVCNIFAHEGISWLATLSNRHPSGWSSIHEGIVDEGGRGNGSFTIQDPSGPSRTGHDKLYHSGNENYQGSLQTGSSSLRSRLNVCFDNKEIVKRNGELLEAICVNSCDEKQIAVASNRKGLLFYGLNLEQTSSNYTEYIWSESDWPQNAWARSLFASPGVDFGDQKSVHFGLGGATVGLSPLLRPGRDLTGGGAFGIPGYAGIGASGLGWGEQEYLEEFMDPHVTVETISTRAISSHPSRPLFLVGSNNTYIYLWESPRMRSIGVFRCDLAVRVFRVVASGSVPPLPRDLCCIGIHATVASESVPPLGFHAIASGSAPPPRDSCCHLGIRAHRRLGIRALA